jgi:hypothetical protein
LWLPFDEFRIKELGIGGFDRQRWYGRNGAHMIDPRSAVAAALEAVGSHRWVRLEVTHVSALAHLVEIDLVIHYPCATPVCCGQPGCYVGFLGLHRTLVPEALGDALGIQSPAITIRAQLLHEPGYRYIDHGTGRLIDEGVDQLQIYGPDHFASPPP